MLRRVLMTDNQKTMVAAAALAAAVGVYLEVSYHRELAERTRLPHAAPTSSASVGPSAAPPAE